MRKLFWLLLLAAAVSGCANHPSHTTQAPPVAARNDAPPPTPPTEATAGPAGGEPAANLDLLKQGYKPVVHRGETVYCRKEMLTGSRFASQVCLTDRQIKDMQQRAKDDLQSVGAGCNGGGCKGGG
jgi:hypothetical protein